MPVISLCSPKGGCGKTTTAILIISELITRGATVSLVDGDRQRWATKWANLQPISDNLRIVSAAGLEDVEFHELVAAEAKQSTFVVCDLEGNVNPLITVAMMLSDLVLVPLAKAANYDLAAAVKMFNSIEMNSQKLKNPINYLAFFNNVGAIRNRFQIQNEADLEASGVNIMKTRLAERAAYSEYPSFGGLFRDIPKSEVPNLDKAIENIDNFLDEILDNLRSEKERRAASERVGGNNVVA
jgi:chromosome partitioning protein